MATPPQLLEVALDHHRAGRLGPAEQIYRQLVAAHPGYADPWHLLGLVLHARGETALALDHLRRAIALDPKPSHFHSNLGNVLRDAQRPAEALECYRRALELEPRSAMAHNNLGSVLSDTGRWEEAAACYRHALALQPGYVEAQTNLGNALRELGRHEEAVASCRQALVWRPAHAEAHNALGTALGDLGRTEEAAAAYRRAIELRPDFAEAHNNLGSVLMKGNGPAEGEPCFRRALALRPSFAEAHSNLGTALLEQGRPDEALACFRRAVALKDYAIGHAKLGRALLDTGEAAAATDCLRRAIALQPQDSDLHNDLGNALQTLGRYQEAVASYRQALALKPDSALAHGNLGCALLAMARSEQAEASCRRAVELDPNLALGHNNLGNAVRDQGRPEEAVAHLQRALEILPKYPEAYNSLACAYQDLGRQRDAERCYERSLELNPKSASARYNRAIHWLLRGDYRRGWPEYEWRLKMKGFGTREFPQPRWDGGPLDGKTILLYTEQGYGDTLQFVRFAPLVKARGGRVLLACPPKLVRLLAGTPGVDQVINELARPPQFDVQAPLPSLPHLLQAYDKVPADVPYLFPPAELIDAWREALTGVEGLRVGLAWQGNPRHRNDKRRSIPLSAFEPLARVPGVRLISVQKGDGADQVERAGGQVPVLDALQGKPDDFAETAALVRTLDLVISVDSALAHLAGGLGVPTWVLLTFAPDWRWGLERKDSDWYPTARLFRQPERGNWPVVLERVAAALRGMVDTGGARRAESGKNKTEPTAGELLEAGTRLLAEGRPRDAVASYQRAVELEPATAAAHHGLGDALRQLRNFEGARAAYGRAVELKPDWAEAHGSLGRLLLSLGQFAEACACFERAVAAQPTSAEAHEHLGLALADLGRAEEAVAALGRATELAPNAAPAHYHRARVLYELERVPEAVEGYRRALELRPDIASAHCNLGCGLWRLGRRDEAVGCYRRALALNPFDAAVHVSLGSALWDLGQREEADACYRRALELKPDMPTARVDRALYLLFKGDYERGWPEFEWRRRLSNYHIRSYPEPEWQGEPLEGKTILLHPEQGLGDTIQLARFVPLVKARGAEVILACQPELVRLLRTAPGFDAVVSQEEPLPPFEVRVPLFSLPLHLRTTLATIPPPPACQPPPDRVAYWKERLADVSGLRVGIVWQGNPKQGTDWQRSAPLAVLAPLAQLEGVRLVSLQKGAGSEQLESLPDKMAILDLGGELDDFAETAAVLRCLDLVVCVDTAITHLAGTLGVPTWLLVSAAPDWRWLQNRADSPWYPAVRIFRQQRLGDWGSVVQEIAAALRQRLTGRPEERVPDVVAAALEHQRAGRFQQAEQLSRRAVAEHPECASAHATRGDVLRTQGQREEAVGSYRQAVALQPDHAEANLGLGTALRELRRIDEALQAYRRAVASSPDSAVAHGALGSALWSVGRVAEAKDCFQRQTELRPDDGQAHADLGAALLDLGQPEGAARHCRQAVALNPSALLAHFNLGRALAELGRYADAAGAYRRVIELRPDHAPAHCNVGCALTALGQLDEADECYRRALALNPHFADAHHNHGLYLLAQGDFARGWPEYEWRRRMRNFHIRSFAQPEWDGAPLQGKTILLHREQGYGDTIQFARFAPLVQQRGGRVILACQPALLGLLQGCPGTERVVAEDGELPTFDVQVPLLELPRLLGTTLETIPPPGPCRVPAARVAAWARELEGLDGIRVGLVWQGNPGHLNDRNRSAPLAVFEPLSRVPGVRLVSLQKGAGREQLDALGGRMAILDVGGRLPDDFSETAAVVRNLDVVVCVDTALVHLAATLGVPTWLLVSGTPDWRWLRGRTDSPWYPALRLFRQQRLGDWGEVLRRVAEELPRLTRREA